MSADAEIKDNDQQKPIEAAKETKPGRHHCHDHGGHHVHHHQDNDVAEEEEEKLDLSEYYYPDANEIGLLHAHLKSLPDFSAYTHLKKLILRQNLLTNLNGLECMSELISLDCYLNSFEKIPDVILQFPKLEWLDFSFNSIRAIANLDTLTNLKKLYLVNNKIKKMNGLNALTSLTMLELGSNRIRSIEGIDKLTNITELWLGKNKIRALQGLDSLINLRLLSIQSNRITQIGNGLKFNVNLQELYLSHNGLQSMDEGLLFLPNLKTLDLAGNFITKLENLQNAKKLKELWMNDNKIDTFEGLNCITSSVIETIYLERNPVQLDDPYKYKQHILATFPSLQQLDALPLLSRMRANKIEKKIEYKTDDTDNKQTKSE